MKRILCFAVASLLTLFCAAGCGASGSNDSSMPGSYSADAKNVRSIEAEVNGHPVIVDTADGGRISVTYPPGCEDSCDISDSGGILRVSLTEASENGSTDSDEAVRIGIPSGQIESLCVMTQNAPADVSSVRVSESVQLSSVDADVHVENLYVGKSISVDVENGSMTGTLAGSVSDYDVTTTVIQGHSNLPESTEKGTIALTLTAENGDIDLQFADSAEQN